MEVTKKSRLQRWFGWLPSALDLAREYAGTVFVLLFIFNGLATFLILFNWIDASTNFKKLVGALAFSFAALALMMFINEGVKRQIEVKKKTKRSK